MYNSKDIISGRVRIQQIEPMGEDQRGTTFALPVERKGDLLAGFRNAGSTSGNHYHLGLSPGKNPEVFLLLNGTSRWRFVDLLTGQRDELDVEAPARIEVWPKVWHSVEAVTDIVFLELNSLDEHKADTMPLHYEEAVQRSCIA